MQQALVDSLLTQCTTLRSKVAQLETQIENQRAEMEYYLTLVPELRAELAEVHRDKARLDWLNGNCVCLTPMYTTNTPTAWCATNMTDPTRYSFHNTVREAIDTAMEVTK